MHDTGQDQRDLPYESRWEYYVTCGWGSEGKGLMKEYQTRDSVRLELTTFFCSLMRWGSEIDF